MLPDNVGYLFDAALRLNPSKAAAFQDDTVLTFADLDTRANRVATALGSLGVGPGDRVALMFGNDCKFVEAVLGPMRLGAVPVPLNIRMSDDTLGYVLEDSEATVRSSSTMPGPRSGRVRSGSWSSGTRASPGGTGSWPRRGPRNSGTAGCTPAISCAGTPRVTTTSSAARMT